VNMTYKTTFYLTPIDVKRTEQVDLQDTQLVKIKLTEDEYPIPFHRTNLFAVIMAFVVTFILLLVIFYYVLKRREDRYYRKPEEEEAKEDVEVETTSSFGAAGEMGSDGDDAGDGPEEQEDEVEDEIDRLLRESAENGDVAAGAEGKEED
jgi:flagellar biosynthesis/type III secretory pathway M-ring protein FliF/YscJ